MRTTGGRQRRGTIGVARAALTVLVVGGSALGALLLHPGTSLSATGRGLLGDNSALVIGFALLALLGGYALRGQYLNQIRDRVELTPVEQRWADGVSRFLLLAPAALALLILLLHRFGSFSNNPETGPVLLPAKPSPTPFHRSHDSVDAGLSWILAGLGFVLFAAAVLLAGGYLWRYLTRPPVPRARASYATPDDEQERLAQVVDSGRRALRDGADARTAVIACYVAMEESLADSGTARRASDSPQDLLERAVAGGVPARAAAAELTALFREARYSSHPMDGGHRDRAAAALAEIADALRSRARAPKTVAGDA